MTQTETDYVYIRRYGHYLGVSEETITRWVAQAVATDAPQDAFRFLSDKKRWRTVDEITDDEVRLRMGLPLLHPEIAASRALPLIQHMPSSITAYEMVMAITLYETGITSDSFHTYFIHHATIMAEAMAIPMPIRSSIYHALCDIEAGTITPGSWRLRFELNHE